VIAGTNERGTTRLRNGPMAGVSVLLAPASILAKQVQADAAGNCRYQVSVQRQEGRVLSARVCDVGDLVNWLRVTPGAEVSTQAPDGGLLDGFTVTILVQYRPLQPDVLRPLLTETVYPLAMGGPVAFVRSRTIFHEFTAYPRWVMPAGWRTLDPTEPVPPVLRRLGLPEPEFQPSPSTGGTGQATESTGSPASLSTVAAGQPTESTKPKPDLITLAFLLIVLATAALLVRRGVARSRKDAQERDAMETRVGPGDV
jgi:hypothetical protein